MPASVRLAGCRPAGPPNLTARDAAAPATAWTGAAALGVGSRAVIGSPTGPERFGGPHPGRTAVLVESPTLPSTGERGPAVIERRELALRSDRRAGVGGVRVGHLGQHRLRVDPAVGVQG